MNSSSKEVTRLLRLAKESTGKPQSVIEICKEILQYPRDTMSDLDFGRAHYLSGFAKRMLGRLGEAEEELRYTEEIARSASQWHLLGSVSLELGKLSSDLRRSDNALMYLHTAAELFKQTLDVKSEAISLFTAGHVYWLEQKEKQTLECMNRSLSKFIEVDFDEGATAVYRALAQMDMERGRYEKARERLELCARLYPNRTQTANWLHLDLTLANCYYHLDHKERSDSLIRETIERASALGYPYIECRGALLLSHHLSNDGEQAKAATLRLYANEIAEKHGFAETIEKLSTEMK